MCAYKARQSVCAQHNQCAELAGHTAIPMFLNFASRPLSTSSKLSIMVSCVNVDGSTAACFNLRAERLASRSSISIRRYLFPSQLEMRAFAPPKSRIFRPNSRNQEIYSHSLCSTSPYNPRFGEISLRALPPCHCWRDEASIRCVQAQKSRSRRTAS